MPKNGYTVSEELNEYGDPSETNVNNIDVSITSTIYLADFNGYIGNGSIIDQFDYPTDLTSYPVSPNENGIFSRKGMYLLDQFSRFVHWNIDSIWTTSTNLGLQPPFSNSNYSLKTTTNVVVVNFCDDTLTNRIASILGSDTPLPTNLQEIGDLYVKALENGEVLIEVLPGSGRSFIGAIKSCGIWAGANRNLGTFMVGMRSMDPPDNINEDPSLNLYIPPQQPNMPAHEFGHILGLADRYTSIYNHIRQENKNVHKGGGVARLGFVPIYLPGLYDPDLIINENDEFKISNTSYVPYQYNTSKFPFGMTYRNNISGLNSYPNGDVGKTPQTNFNGNAFCGGGFYDYEYSTLFGWIHNIMSRPYSVNDSNNSSELRDKCHTYNKIYGAYFLNFHPTIIITTTQINILRNQSSYEDLKFIKGMQLFKSIHRDSFGSHKDGSIDIELKPYDSNTINFDETDTVSGITTTNRLTFAGLCYNNNWDNKNKLIEVDWENVSMVDDGRYLFTSSQPSIDKIGLDDVMDFRITKYKGNTKKMVLRRSSFTTFLHPFRSEKDEVDFFTEESELGFIGTNLIELLTSLLIGVVPNNFQTSNDVWRVSSNKVNNVLIIRFTFYTDRMQLNDMQFSSYKMGLFRDDDARRIWDLQRMVELETLLHSFNPQRHHGIDGDIFPHSTARGGNAIIINNLHSNQRRLGDFQLQLGFPPGDPHPSIPDYVNHPEVKPTPPFPTTPLTPIVRWEEKPKCIAIYLNDGKNDINYKIKCPFFAVRDLILQGLP